MGCGDEGCKVWRFLGTVIAVLTVLIIGAILVAVSMKGIHYYEYGFVRTKTTGEVDTTKIYQSGLHALGPSKDFITFQADAHFVKLEDLQCGTKSGNEVEMTVSFQYILSKDDLDELYQEYNVEYDDIIEASATEALKQTTIQFENLELMREREKIELALSQAVRSRIHNNCCPTYCTQETERADEFCDGCVERASCTKEDKGLYVHLYDLQLGEISLPEDLRERFLNALLLQVKSEEAALSKNVTGIVQDTKILVNVIQNEADEILANATAKADLMQGKAEAEARAVVEHARIDGLLAILHSLNITESSLINDFHYHTNLIKRNNRDVSINFDHCISK